MKKHMNTFLIGVLSAALLFSLYVFPSVAESVSFNQENSSSLVQDDVSEVTTVDGEDSKTLSLYSLYARVEDTMKLLPANKSDDTNNTYVDYYGGCYIEDNSLVVCLTDMNILNTRTVPVLQERTISVKEVTYSYNQMDGIENLILNKYEQLYSQFQTAPDSPEFLLLSSIMGTAIDEKENHLRVDILNLNAEKEAVFLKLFGVHNCVVLNNCMEEFQDLVTTYNPGSGLSFTASKIGYCSMGYRAAYKVDGETKIGFVTCAHGVEDSVDDDIISSKDNRKIGTIITSKFSGASDVAFVERFGDYSISRIVEYKDENGSTPGTDTMGEDERWFRVNLPKGHPIIKVGAVTYRTTGKITDASYNETIEGVSRRNYARADIICKKGDSGGLVYAYDDAENLYAPVGIVSFGNGYNTMGYCKAFEIEAETGIYPW